MQSRLPLHGCGWLAIACIAACAPTTFMAPPPATGAIAEPEVPVSEAMVDVVVRAETLHAAVDRELPNPIHRQNDSQLQAEATRGALSLTPVQGGIQWTLPVELWARARLGPIRVSCGIDEARPQVSVTLRTELRIDEEWNLGTATTPGPLRWSRPCRVSFLNIDVSSMIDPHIARAQQQAARAIDSEAARIPLAELAHRIWPLLFFPLELGGGQRVLMQPEGLRIAELNGDESALVLRVGAAGRFRITQRMVSTPPRPLPPPMEDPGGPLVVALDVPLTTDALMAAVTDPLVGREMAVADGLIRIDRAQGRIVDHGMAIGLSIRGAHHGEVWVVATPLWGAEGVTLIDARFTSETLEVLGSKADDLHPVIRALEKQRFDRIGIVDLVAARERAVSALAAVEVPAGVSIRLELSDPPPSASIYSDGSGLVVRALLEGQLSVQIDAAAAAASFE